MKVPGDPLMRFCVLLLSLHFSYAAFAQNARVQAELASPVVALGEAVNLQIVANGIDAELDVSSLEADFELVSRGSSRQVNIFNGVRESTVIWNIEIMPRREGQLVVPPVTVGQLSTQPLLLQVTPAPSGSDRQVYVEASVDTTQPFVQAQVIYTLKVYQRVQFSNGSLGYPNAPGLTVQQIEADAQSTENVNGQLYNVLQRRYVLFPQTSGPIVVPPVTLQGEFPGKRSSTSGGFVPRSRFTRQSNEIQLNVQPRPASFTGQWWLPVSALELQAQWVTPADEFVVGRPLTRTITLVANGVGEAQLPEIPPPELPTAKTYADASEASTVSVPSGVQAQRRFSWAIIPQQAGSLTLPELKLPWFDVVSGTMQIATVPEQTIEIQAAAGEALTNNPATVAPIRTDTDAGQVDNSMPLATDTNNLVDSTMTSEQLRFWKRLALILGVAWGATLLAWAYYSWRKGRALARQSMHKSPTPTPRIPVQIAAVAAAVKDNDMAALSRSVSAWGKAAYGTGSASPAELAGRVQSTELRQSLNALDAALYSPNPVRDTASFAGLAELLRAEPPVNAVVKRATGHDEYALPSL